MPSGLPRFLINGLSTSQVDVADRALHYGDGLFETIFVDRGRPQFWAEHFSRLQLGCDRLGLHVPDCSNLETELKLLIGNADLAVLKLIVSAGVGGRGYRRDEKPAVTRILALYPYPNYNPEWFKLGVDVRVCKHRLAMQPAFAGIKHLNRLDQVIARQEWGENYQEGLMLDQAGTVVEATMSNLFILHGGVLKTPPIEGCGVAGIIRAKIMEQTAQKVVEEILSLDDIHAADAVFLTNSIIGVWQVRSLEAKQWAVPHPMLATIRQWAGR